MKKMKAKIQNWALPLVTLYSLAFLLNFIWEYLHYPLYICVLSRIECSFVASVGDANLIFGLYVFGAIVFKDTYWIKKFSFKKIVYSIFASLVLAVIIEKHALIAGRWAYNSYMPIIPVFDVGLSPLLQLIVLTLATYYMLHLIFFSKKHHRN